MLDHSLEIAGFCQLHDYVQLVVFNKRIQASDDMRTVQPLQEIDLFQAVVPQLIIHHGKDLYFFYSHHLMIHQAQGLVYFAELTLANATIVHFEVSNCTIHSTPAALRHAMQ